MQHASRTARRLPCRSIMKPQPPVALGADPFTDLTSAAPPRDAKGESLRRSLRPSSVATIILATLAVAYTVAIARPFLLPIAFAWLARSALGPLVRNARRIGLPSPLSAAVILLALTSGCIYGLYELSGPAAEWAERLPDDIRNLRDRLNASGGGMEKPMASVDEASKAVAELTESASEGSQLKVTMAPTRPFNYLVGGAWVLSANILITLVLLYFMLATGDALLHKLVQLSPNLSGAKAAVATVRAIERGIARYLLTVVAINFVLGTLVGTACYLFGLPNPVLWGVLAMVFNFVPYVGALVGIVLIVAVGLQSSPDFGIGLAPALIYAILTAIEGMVITPIVVGRQLTLSPVLLFVWLLLMSWLWGIPGALLAVPLLATAKITCDHLPRLKPIGKLLGASSRASDGSSLPRAEVQ
tara:strand:+ start:185 stop:1432 length:1248 start_codon:yes stop_codon:yes gene_type:complete